MLTFCAFMDFKSTFYFYIVVPQSPNHTWNTFIPVTQYLLDRSYLTKVTLSALKLYFLARWMTRFVAVIFNGKLSTLFCGIWCKLNLAWKVKDMKLIPQTKESKVISKRYQKSHFSWEKITYYKRGKAKPNSLRLSILNKTVF